MSVSWDREFLQAALDALLVTVAVLDRRGTILLVNEEWRRFGDRNGLSMSDSGVGSNYLEPCERAAEEGDADALRAARGLRRVLRGESGEYSQEYPCHSPDCRRWFVLRANRFRTGGEEFGLVAHHDVTARRLAEEDVRDHRDRLRDMACHASLAAEYERRALSMRLHDEIAQPLLALKLFLDLWRRGEKTGDAGWSEGEELLAGAIRSARDLVDDLASPVLHELGLAAALQGLADRAGEVHGLEEVTFQADEQAKPVGRDLSVVLFHGARELVENAVRHGEATRLAISLRADRGRLRLEVRDDGKGFDTEAQERSPRHERGLGLFQIRERLYPFGGHLEVSSAPGRGTRAVMVVNLAQEKENPPER